MPNLNNVVELRTVARTVTFEELINYCRTYEPDATAQNIYWVALFYPKNHRFFRLPETNALARLYNSFANYKEKHNDTRKG